MSVKKTTLGSVIAALFPNSEKAVSEKLDQSEFDAFAAEAEETQKRLDAQTAGNEAVAADLAAANAKTTALEATVATASTDLATAQASLRTAQEANVGLKAKADQWDAYKASLTGASLTGDATNGKPAEAFIGADDEARIVEMQRLKAKYPNLMADLDVPAVADED